MFPIIPANSATAAASGNSEGIFGFGKKASGGVFADSSQLVSNAGVVSSNVAGVGSTRSYPAATQYGGDKGIFGYGYTPSATAVTNLVSNTGVVASDQAAVTGTARGALAACSYGGDKGIFGYGATGGAGTSLSETNLVSNAGVVSTDVVGVGTVRTSIAATEYGGDKGIFGFGTTGSASSITNLVSNAGVVASDQAATTGTARLALTACSFN
jgi:hypothetical protein